MTPTVAVVMVYNAPSHHDPDSWHPWRVFLTEAEAEAEIASLVARWRATEESPPEDDDALLDWEDEQEEKRKRILQEIKEGVPFELSHLYGWDIRERDFRLLFRIEMVELGDRRSEFVLENRYPVEERLMWRYQFLEAKRLACERGWYPEYVMPDDELAALATIREGMAISSRMNRCRVQLMVWQQLHGKSTGVAPDTSHPFCEEDVQRILGYQTSEGETQ